MTHHKEADPKIAAQNLQEFYFHLSAATVVLETDSTLTDVRYEVMTVGDPKWYESELHAAGRKVALPHLRAASEALRYPSVRRELGAVAFGKIEALVEGVLETFERTEANPDSYQSPNSLRAVRYHAANRVRVARDFVAVALAQHTVKRAARENRIAAAAA